VTAATVQVQAFDSVGQLIFCPHLIVNEGLLELVLGFHVGDNCGFAVVIYESGEVLVALNTVCLKRAN
jgi:hypothetical protein